MKKNELDASLRVMEKIIKKEFPKVLKRKEIASKERKKILRNFSLLSEQLLNEAKNEEIKKLTPPVHPWRVCPLHHHWVRTHPRRVKPTKKNPDGYTLVDGHCRVNPSKKDQIVNDEIQRISQTHFHDLQKNPCSLDLGYNKKNINGCAYDQLIAGWTQYWNDIFKPQDVLDVNLVKALIASESGFNKTAINTVSKRKNIKARGLMQITDETLKILNNDKGELKSHLIKISKSEIMDPSVNIYAGIRWLFHKKDLTSKKLKRPATWLETVANYKAALADFLKQPNGQFEVMKPFMNFYSMLVTCGK